VSVIILENVSVTTSSWNGEQLLTIISDVATQNRNLMIRLHLLVAIPMMTASILLPSFVTTQTESANQAAMCTRTATATSTASATKVQDVPEEVLDLAVLDVEIREALAH